MSDETKQNIDQLVDEIENFREIALNLRPSSGEVPRIPGIEIAGFTMSLQESIGGDHLIWLDFGRRYNLKAKAARARKKNRPKVAARLEKLHRRAGILLADVSGHRMTDALIAAMLHQAFLVGVQYELDRYGEITTRVFEHINTRFYRTTSVNKYFTMIYGEISDKGRFRFISAAHHPPKVFSSEYGRFVQISDDRLVSFPPVGLLPTSDDEDDPGDDSVLKGKKKYSVNEISLLAKGDILLLLTDGLADHDRGRFFPGAVEALLADSRGLPLNEIVGRLKDAIRESGPAEDDISAVLVRRAV